MGYSFGWNSKKELISYLTKGFGEEYKTSTIAHSCAGNILWSVMERTEVKTGKTERFIACAILRSESGDWGYKGMDEACHPYQYTCPLKYLDLAPVACEEWRAKVREYWAGKKEARKKNADLQPGTKIELPEGWTVREFTLTERVKNTWRAYGKDGRLYRLPLKAIQQSRITAAP